MSQQAKLVAARSLLLDVAVNDAAPTDGSTRPDLTLSPITSAALPTTGFLLILKAPDTTPAVPTGTDDTFTITPWVRDPVTNVWGAGEPTAIGYDQAFVTGDINAADLYFQITDSSATGKIVFHVAEVAFVGAGLRRAFSPAGSGTSGGTTKITPFDDGAVIRIAVTTIMGQISAEPRRAYLLLTNQSTTRNLFIRLGDGVDATPGAELATIILPPNTFAGYEVLNYTGIVSYVWDGADASGYSLATQGIYPL